MSKASDDHRMKLHQYSANGGHESAPKNGKGRLPKQSAPFGHLGQPQPNGRDNGSTNNTNKRDKFAAFAVIGTAIAALYVYPERDAIGEKLSDGFTPAIENIQEAFAAPVGRIAIQSSGDISEEQSTPSLVREINLDRAYQGNVETLLQDNFPHSYTHNPELTHGLRSIVYAQVTEQLQSPTDKIVTIPANIEQPVLDQDRNPATP